MNLQELEKVGIDYECGISRMNGNEELYWKYLRKFLDEPSYAECLGAIARGDMEQAKLKIHTLKGVAGTLGITELMRQSVALETKLKDGEQMPDVDGLKKAYETVVWGIDHAE